MTGSAAARAVVVPLLDRLEAEATGVGDGAEAG